MVKLVQCVFPGTLLERDKQFNNDKLRQRTHFTETTNENNKVFVIGDRQIIKVIKYEMTREPKNVQMSS